MYTFFFPSGFFLELTGVPGYFMYQVPRRLIENNKPLQKIKIKRHPKMRNFRPARSHPELRLASSAAPLAGRAGGAWQGGYRELPGPQRRCCGPDDLEPQNELHSQTSPRRDPKAARPKAARRTVDFAGSGAFTFRQTSRFRVPCK